MRECSHSTVQCPLYTRKIFAYLSTFETSTSKLNAPQAHPLRWLYRGPDGDLAWCTTFFSIKPNIHQTLMRDWLWPVHYSRTILQKQFRKMSGMRQPPWPLGSRDYWTDHLLCIMTPRPFTPTALRSLVRSLTPKARIPARTHTTPPTTTRVSRSAITIISICDGWPAARTDIFRPRCTWISYIRMSAQLRGSTFNCIEITGRVLLLLHVAFLNPDWIWCELRGIFSAIQSFTGSAEFLTVRSRGNNEKM